MSFERLSEEKDKKCDKDTRRKIFITLRYPVQILVIYYYGVKHVVSGSSSKYNILEIEQL